MVNLKAKPFCLNDEQIAWVESTIEGMTLDEKIGQLFILLKATPGINEEQIKDVLSKYGQGGHRWQGGNKDAAYEQNLLYQKHSKYPLFVAANCDDGGNGVCPEGTFVATAAEAGAGEGDENAYHMGLVAGREASAVGANWMFNPVVDIYFNWRNTIVNTRSFGNDADKVLANARAYIRGIKDANPNMACTAKHFPGDGVDELDPHLALAINDLSVEDWEASFGKVYRTLIDEGLEAIMPGQIALPAYSRKLVPGIKDSEIMPATLAPEIITTLLREDMGFNGVVVTDATHMIGMAAVMPREESIPRALAAGCDMILFANDIEEDINFVKQGLEKGIITEERFSDALHRILGLKAKLHLNDEELRYAKKEWLDCVGCEEHHQYAAKAADECVTLVKDTKNFLPWDVKNKKKALLVYTYTTPNSKGFAGDPIKEKIGAELERVGFEVTYAPNFYDMEVQNGPHPMNFVKMLNHDPRSEYKKKYDVIFVFANVKGYAQTNTMRITWSCNHSCEMHWYTEEVPTIAVSLNYTNHLIDLAQIHTYINAYGSNEENIRAAVEKIVGKSEFKGTANDTVFCGRWDTRL